MLTEEQAMRKWTIFALLISTHAAFAQTRLADPGALDRYLDEAVARTYIPGLVALATDADGTIYTHAAGKRDVAGGKPMTIDTIFRIASMTKPVTSAAIMMLVDEGRIELDDPVEDYLPQLADRRVFVRFSESGVESVPARTTMTVRHLLTHTSGLAYTFSNATLARMVGSSGTRATEHPLVHEPGTRWSYGESTRVLGEIVEAVTGKNLETFMRERIFEPLGMTQTSYSVPPSGLARVATVHRMTDDGLVEQPNGDSVTSPTNGDGGLNSTVEDYARFIRLILNDGVAPDGRRLISSESVAAMGRNNIGDVRVSMQQATSPAVSRDFPLGAGTDTFGLGFQITESANGPGRARGSMAWAGIFNTEFWIDPATGVGGVLMMQFLPFYDEAAIDTLVEWERLLYEQLP
jgi:CubicO group peptidase (beta-lactamase class C family)